MSRRFPAGRPRKLCHWADADGRFPDDPACDPAVVAAQPVGERLRGNWSGDSTVVALNRAERRARQRRRMG
jgi:hypothetical protein